MQQPKWGFQIKVDNKWEFVHPSNNMPVVYDTKDEAYSMSYMCYPDLWRQQRLGHEKLVRVKEVKPSQLLSKLLNKISPVNLGFFFWGIQMKHVYVAIYEYHNGNEMRAFSSFDKTQEWKNQIGLENWSGVSDDPQPVDSCGDDYFDLACDKDEYFHVEYCEIE